MYNRKFNIKKDFGKLNELENEMLPIIRKKVDKEEYEKIRDYMYRIFNNQFKNKKQ